MVNDKMKVRGGMDAGKDGRCIDLELVDFLALLPLAV